MEVQVADWNCLRGEANTYMTNPGKRSRHSRCMHNPQFYVSVKRHMRLLYLCGFGTLRWCHNGCDSVSNHQPRDCLLTRLFRRRSKKTSKLPVTGLCVVNSPGTGEFPAQMASFAENVSIWWRHHESEGKTPVISGDLSLYLIWIWLPASPSVPFGRRSSSRLPAQFAIFSNRPTSPGVPYIPVNYSMMTSSNGNIFRVTGHLCGEFTGHWWIPRTKASDAELWCFFLSAPE